MNDLETLQELMASVYLTPRQKEALGRLVARAARTDAETALLGACRRAMIVVGAPEEFLAEASEREIREAIEALRVAERRPRTATCEHGHDVRRCPAERDRMRRMYGSRPVRIIDAQSARIADLERELAEAREKAAEESLNRWDEYTALKRELAEALAAERRQGVEAVEDERQALLGPCGAE